MYTTVVDIQELAVKTDSHSFRIMYNKGIVSLLRRCEPSGKVLGW